MTLNPILDNLAYFIELKITRYRKEPFKEIASPTMLKQPIYNYNSSWACLAIEGNFKPPEELRDD